MVIRKKELRDCESWVDININSWHEFLKDVVSKRVLEIMTRNREARIENDINNLKNDDGSYVLEENDRVIGIMKLKKSDRKDYENAGEIQILYLARNELGKGYGKILVDKAFEILREKGYKKCLIGCLVGNPSNGFYEHIGGKFVGREPWEIFGEHYEENIYEYYL